MSFSELFSNKFHIILTLFICFLVSCSNSGKTLGNYYGISRDNKWETNFKVYEHDKDFLLKGEIICLDADIMKKLKKDDLEKNQIKLIKGNGLEFGGNFLYDGDKKLTIINYVKNDSSTYEKMIMKIGDYETELEINKIIP